MPYLTDRITHLASTRPLCADPSANREDADEELLWLAHVAARVVKHSGVALLAYHTHIARILSALLPLAHGPTSALGSKMLRHTLKALLGCYGVLYCCSSRSLNHSLCVVQ
jgi:hypothetical protein